MGAIHFSLDTELVKCIKKQFSIDNLIETGTFEGETVNILQNEFSKIYSTEISIEYFEMAKKKFAHNKNIFLYCEESPVFIKNIIDKVKDDSNIFWLDAHWMIADFAAGEKSQCPLLEEIEAIKVLNEKSFVIIDDARLFLTVPPYPHEVSQWPSLNEIISNLQKLSSNHEISIINDIIVFFPKSFKENFKLFAHKNSYDLLQVLHKSRDYDNLKLQFENLMPQILSQQEQLLGSKLQLIEKDKQIHSLHNFAHDIQAELHARKIPFKAKYIPFEEKIVSIVIPTFNQGQFIRDCLNTVTNQTYTNLEIIIQDSNSTDETESICKEFAKADSRIKYIREKDSGQSDAINRGLSKSTGVYWTWICSDDRYNNLEAVNNLIHEFDTQLRTKEDIVGVYGDAFFMKEDGTYVGEYGNQKRSLTKNDFQHNWPLSQPSSILLTSEVKKVGGVENDLFLGMDLDLFLKMLYGDKKFYYCNSKIVDIRLQDNSKSVKYRKDTAVNALNIIKKHFGNIGDIRRSAYFQELVHSENTIEIRKFLSEQKMYFKLKYKILGIIEKFPFLISILRKIRK